MESVHRREAGAAWFFDEPVKDSAGANPAVTPPQAATSAKRCPARFPAAQKLDPHSFEGSHHLAPGGPGFFGMKMDPGGAILFTTEKLRSFSASAIRPREST